MKHPFWIVNSTLVIFILLALLLGFFMRVHIPKRPPLEPGKVAPRKKDELVQINIEKIYENDLFDTYVKVTPPIERPDYAIPFPEPPRPTIARVPDAPKPTFLDPLDVVLKGLFVVSGDPSKSRAIIEDNKTNKEATYKVGDTVLDAQLIRIYGNKVILLRANGQQEVLYLREQDAQLDPAYALIDEWDQVIKPIGPTDFIVSPAAFTMRVTNLAQFINLLGLTTTYRQGKSVGVRVGTVEPKTAGYALGLQTGDIIQGIDGISTISTENRLTIYEHVLEKQPGDTIKVAVSRQGDEFTLSYKLENFSKDQDKPELQPLKEKEKINILKQKHEFAPTLKELRNRERKNMIEKSQAPDH